MIFFSVLLLGLLGYLLYLPISLQRAARKSKQALLATENDCNASEDLTAVHMFFLPEHPLFQYFLKKRISAYEEFLITHLSYDGAGHLGFLKSLVV